MTQKMSHEEWKKKWAKVVAKAWLNEGFKKELIAHPRRVLTEEGVPCEKMQLKVVENTEEMKYLVLPKKPVGHLSNQELKKMAAAGSETAVMGFDRP